MVTITPPRPIQPVLVAPVISNSVVRQDKVPSTAKTIQHQHTACQQGIDTQHTVMAMMSPRTVTVPNNMILRSVALGNAARQLAKHKQVYKWAAERVLNRTDIQWSRSRMPTLSSLEDVRHLLSPDVREAVLTKFTAGTVLEAAKGGPLILGYDCDDMPTLETLTDFFATQGLPAALTETTRKDYDSDWRGWVTFCVVMRKPNAVLPADKQVLMAFMSQLILCQYVTGTIGKFLSCIVTKHSRFGYPSPQLYREMGSWLLGLKKNTSSGVKTRMRLNPIHIRLIASLLTTSLPRTRLDHDPAGHLGGVSAIRTGSVGCV